MSYLIFNQCYRYSGEMELNFSDMNDILGIKLIEKRCECGLKFNIPDITFYNFNETDFICPISRAPILIVEIDGDLIYWSDRKCGSCHSCSKCLAIENLTRNSIEIAGKQKQITLIL